MGRFGPDRGHVSKRPYPTEGECNSGSNDQSCSKRLLTSNRFAVLSEEGKENMEKKERLPPFYVKGFPANFQEDINQLVSKGLRATIRLCTDGYKIIVSAADHYRAVEAYLKLKKAEYFTHDIIANKPFKAILRGLPDMEEQKLLAMLEEKKLQPLNVYKMRRNDKHKYRDQLYLVHFPRGSTSIKALSQIRALTNIIIEWERYKPKKRDIIQCTNCLYFGHGGKNCHLAPHCTSCGGDHHTNECAKPAEKPKCFNCEGEHLSNSKECPARANFIRTKQEIADRNRSKRPSRRGPTFNEASFPELQTSQRRQIPVLTPLPLPHQAKTDFNGRQQKTTENSSSQPPGFTTFTQASSQPTNGELYSMEQLACLFLELDNRTRACRTANEQVAVMMTFYFHHSHVLAECK